MKKKDEKIPFLNGKTAFRLGVFIYWAAVFWVSPAFLLAGIPYIVFRIVAYIDDYTKYDRWKFLMYAKSDRKLTFRKLVYFIKEAEKHGIRDASKRTNYNSKFERGVIRVDQYTRIYLIFDEDTSQYQSELYFNGKFIGTSKGFAFQKLNWGTKAFPELERALSKFLHNVELEIKQYEKDKKKASIKRKKAQQEAQEQRQKTLAKEIRKTYKKDMSI